VTQDEEKRPLSELPQAYDTSLKEWISQQAPTILPLLLPGTSYEETLTIELLRPPVRMDKVFKVMYHNQEHILDLEFEAGYDNHLNMQNVHVDLIDQIMRELAALYRDDEVTLEKQFTWMQLLVERTETISDWEKVKIKEKLAMFDKLWEESPMVQKMREQSHQEGRQETLQAFQDSLVNAVCTRYPELAEFAQQQASHWDKPSILASLLQQVATTPDAETVRKFLEAGTDL